MLYFLQGFYQGLSLVVSTELEFLALIPRLATNVPRSGQNLHAVSVPSNENEFNIINNKKDYFKKRLSHQS